MIVNLAGKMKFAGAGSGWVDSFNETYKLQTGYTLLDIDGAERLGRDMTSPARVLLMGPAGDLMIRNEEDDRDAVSRLRLIFTERKGRRGERDGLRGGPEGMPFGPPGGPGSRGR